MPDQAAPLDDRSPVTIRLRRAACAATALLFAGALVAGCGGGSPNGGVASLGTHTSESHSPSTSGTAAASEGREASPTSQAIAYTACMHAHGVPSYPESNPSASKYNIGNTAVDELKAAGVNPNSPVVQAAVQACEQANPVGSL